ncbi:winged helix-turn-helix domain-containing protein/riboflavin kinase [Picrophilus oshimae]|uniref:Riboflavin kinase n=1 Tax=Picrophilus torridus (strain ATCC 700027 / DSM 9790 / JCM 10055 / NBRC 100828 / KAW 2/3) TaxID=1122961 RepID=A0A8G2FXC2_PICTO|nr:winged helix-turn-helix domain-containing protein/riboflavin kinase [Picrophilus oshimae]SMD31178.1 CTP-dependent riboflavin kinase [Picrophilus oshimae DSM 9789]
MENIYIALKTIKKMAGEKNTVFISSKELANEMNVSQQTASRIIISLDRLGYITRTLENRKQKITINDSGLDVLYREYNEISSILRFSQELKLVGAVQNGLGEGKYYISKKGYKDQFIAKLGIDPYPGTLNIKILNEYENNLRRIKNSDGIYITGFKDQQRTFGGVFCHAARIDGIRCFIIFPERSVYRDTFEVISEKYLRKELNLENGEIIEVLASIDGKL